MRTPVSPNTPSTLVGRDREISLLRDHLADALAGQGSLVLIGGEAGIGKTALAETLCHEAESQGALVLVGRCYDLSETPPYGPWIELFGGYPPDGLPPLPAAFARRGTIGEVAGQAALFNQVADFLSAVAAQRPLVILLEDLHWADAASLELLRFLARELAGRALLLVVTYRADELTRRHPLYQLLPVLVREAQAARLDVRPLHEAAIRALIAARYHLSTADTDRLVAHVVARAEGNAFFTGELLRALEEEGVLRPLAGGWTLGDLTRTRVPLLLRQVIDGRVARLNEEGQTLLAVAAVIGQEVPISLWATVAKADEDAVLNAVAQGVAARLLVETEDEGVQFAHALIREALYEGLLRTHQRPIHRAVADALMSQRDPDPDAVAHHLQRAGDPRAAEWFVRAGQRAQAVFADRTMVERFENAVRLFEEHDRDEHERGWALMQLGSGYRLIDCARGLQCLTEALRVAESVGDRALQMCVLLRRAWLQNDSRRATVGLGDLLAANALGRELNDAERAELRARGIGMDPSYFDGNLTEYLTNLGRFTEARALGESFAAARSADLEARPERMSWGQATMLGDCYRGLMTSYFYQGESEKAARAAARARICYSAAHWDMMLRGVAEWELQRILTYEPERVAERRRLAEECASHVARWSQTSGIMLPPFGRIPVLALEGQWEEAHAIAAAISPSVSVSLQASRSRLRVGELDRARGQAASAWSVVRDIFPDGPKVERVERYYTYVEALDLGIRLALDSDDLTAAAQWLRAYDDLLAHAEAVIGLSEGQAMWAVYYRMSGDAEQAYQHADRALSHATKPRQPLALIAAHRLLGELETEAGRYADAGTHLDASLGLADACVAPYERALTLLALAELHTATGKRIEAETLLDEVRAICTLLGAKPALARVDALVARLVRTESPAYPAGLTAREVDVLRLVAQGLMNAQIAERLFLSERTVEQHLRSIYNKLGSSSRAAASVFAVQQGLMDVK